MKNKPLCLYVSQYGSIYQARTLKELRAILEEGGHVSKMYMDKKDGSSVHVGYVIGRLQLTKYVPFEKG